MRFLPVVGAGAFLSTLTAIFSVVCWRYCMVSIGMQRVKS